jgi:hypothetical protein
MQRIVNIIATVSMLKQKQVRRGAPQGATDRLWALGYTGNKGKGCTKQRLHERLHEKEKGLSLST